MQLELTNIFDLNKMVRIVVMNHRDLEEHQRLSECMSSLYITLGLY